MVRSTYNSIYVHLSINKRIKPIQFRYDITERNIFIFQLLVVSERK